MLKNNKTTHVNELDFEKSININHLSRLLHDAKLPITVLQSLSDIMFKLNEQEEMENYIFMLDSNIKYLIRIMESLKDEINNLDNKNTEMLHTDIIGYTEMLVDSVRPVCEITNISINFLSDCEYFEYSMNYRFYERIILNVLKNSIRHAKNCSNIDIIVKMIENKIKICINDNGQNDKDISDKVNLENSFVEKSTGEGLYIITSLAKELEAEVEYLITSEGMRFTLVLTINEAVGLDNETNAVQLEMEQIDI